MTYNDIKKIKSLECLFTIYFLLWKVGMVLACFSLFPGELISIFMSSIFSMFWSNFFQFTQLLASLRKLKDAWWHKIFSEMEIFYRKCFLKIILCVKKWWFLWCNIGQWWSETIPGSQICPGYLQSSLEQYSPQQSPLTPTDLPKRYKSPRIGLNLKVYLLWKGFCRPQ